ncbi:MAG: phospholipase D-like domain-containing protein [Nanoarchaeota archaeon]
MKNWTRSGKSKLLIVFIILIIFLVLLSLNFNIGELPIEKTGQNISVFMCINTTCEDRLTEFIMQANNTLDCALYELKSEKVIKALNTSLARIRLVIDHDEINARNNFSFVRPSTNSALMHNKFCVSDGKKLLTGSYNPTNNIGDDNNMLVIESEGLAGNYETEFSELWGDTKNLKNKKTKFTIGNATVENYFCPEDDCAQHVSDAIKSANKSIYFMTFSFTHPEIATDIVLKHYLGLDIKGVFERSQKSNFSKYDLLKAQGIDTRWDGNKGTMHHKVFIIDNETVITGSFNPSKNADDRNDENLLIIHDKKIALIYIDEFERVWSKT